MSCNEISMLVKTLKYFGVKNPEEKGNFFSAYFEMISEKRLWGSLTSRTVAEEPNVPVIQSLSMLEVIEESGSKRVGEIGSGGGILGITLAIARDDWSFTLIESSSRKSAFLAEVCGRLGLRNVTVERSRAESLAGSLYFDCVISRATGKLDSVLPLGLALAAPGGMFAALKGKAQRQEVESVARKFRFSSGSGEMIRIEVVEPKLPDWLPEKSRVLIVVARKMLEDIDRDFSED